ncbi:MAG: metal-binding protein ZinT [Tissierellia bacterium]|nr:metal-binding protein ZinT [Tissierellia bacterium]
MKNKKVIVCLLSSLMLISSCANDKKAENSSSNPSSMAVHDHLSAEVSKEDNSKDRVKTYSDKQEISPSYNVSYDLKKGSTYSIICDHTHEKFMLMGFKKTDDVKDIKDDGTKVLSNKTETEVESGESFEVDTDPLYYLKMAHFDTKIDFTVPDDGNYTIFTDIAPGDALNFKIVDGSDELTPTEKEVSDNSKNDIYHGYFEDDQVKDRNLDDWQGEWSSVYPLLKDGSLDEVMEHKAQNGDMSAEEYKNYYDTGYKTDVDKITIDGNNITFTKDGKETTAEYKYDGYEILEYEKGNRGVRFLFTQTKNVDGAPKNIQFSDHNIYPTKASHFHLFFGDQSQQELLKEMDNWPTYYPSNDSKEDIVKDMLAH